VIMLAEQNAVEVEVADRNQDGVNEVIRYEWPGAPGASVVRVYNNEPVSLNVPVDTFALTYSTVATQTASADTVADQPEASVGAWSAGAVYLPRTVDTNKAVAQHFVPTLPAGARSWTITKFRFLAQSDLTATGSTEVQIRTVDYDGFPTNTVLARATVPENSMAVTFGFKTVTFTGCPPLAPGQEVAFVLWCVSGCPSMTIGYYALAGPRNPPMSINGPSWSALASGVIPHEVWAKTTVATTNLTSAKRVERIVAEATVAGSSSPLRVSFPLHNRPEVQ
jgi:hypothetical protein